MRILHSNNEGGLAITIPAPNYLAALMKANPGVSEQLCMEQIANKDLVAGTDYEVVQDSDVPSDRTFRNAWEHDTSEAPAKVKTNMGKAKVIAHDMRRAKRAEDFAPLDIQATIPAQAEAAEAARQNIRDADALVQIAIDDAADEAGLEAALA